MKLRRSDSYFGLHFDFHACPDNVKSPVGGELTEEIIREILRAIKPDFIQIDCKGHPGYASYPSRMGNAISPIQGDPLKLWRKVTEEEGVALYMHYSGVKDHRYAEDHPWQVALHGDGTMEEGANSVFGPYADELLIPQLKELAGEYKVDGVWVDGECWATVTDYSPLALLKFREKTGIDLADRLPLKKGDLYFEEYREFCREGFREYLRHYMNEVHRDYPDFQIASNWSFTNHMPEKVCAPVDFLSGDYSPQDSFNTARYCGRIIEAQDMPWDLMAWNFRCDFAAGHRCNKEPEQIKQEAAAVLSLGGGFQDYVTQMTNGNPRTNDVMLLKDVAEFARVRQPWCHKGRIVPEMCLFLSTHNHYLFDDKLFVPSEEKALKGWTQLLCETQHSFDIRSEHNFLDERPERFKMAVVSDIANELGAEASRKLLDYVSRGGSLIVSGRNAIKDLAAAGLPVKITEEACITEHYISEDGRKWVSVFGPADRIELLDDKGAETDRDAFEVIAMAAEDRGGTDLTNGKVDAEHQWPCGVMMSYGSGRISLLGFDMGQAYYQGENAVARRLIRRVSEKCYTPICKVEGSMYCDAALLEKDGRFMLQLVNSLGGHADIRQMTMDEIPPIGPLTVTIHMPEGKRCARVIRRPSGEEMIKTDLPDDKAGPAVRVTLDRLEIFEILEIVTE